MSDVNVAYDRFKNESVEWDWTFRIQKAQILVSRSAPTEALALLQKDELPPALASTDLGVLKVLYEGIAYRYAQEFERSKEKLDAAESLAASTHPRLLCQVLNAKGALQVQEGAYADAERTYNEAFKLAREHRRPDQEAAAQVSLAWVAIKLERFDEAIERGQSALQLSTSLGMQSYVATTLGNLGYAYSELGNFENALDYYKRGAEASEQSGLVGYTAYWLTGVATSLTALHDFAAAETLSLDTLKRARRLNNAETITICLNNLAELNLRGGHLDEADKYNQEALEMENTGKDHFGVLESALLSGRIETRKRHFHLAEKFFARVRQDPKTPSPLRWEVEARLAKLYEAEGLQIAAKQEYQKAINTIQTAQSAIDRTDLRLSYLSGGIEFYQDYADFLIAQAKPLGALEVADLSRARTLEAGLRAAAKTTRVARPRAQPHQLARRLNSTLLYYWLGVTHSYLWVIAPAKTVYFALPPENEIDPLVKSYREALLGTRDPLESANPDGQKLYSMLIAPAKNLIPPHSKVIILPDGSLYGLNFETLIVPGPKPRYWIEDVTLSTGTSLTLLTSAAVNSAPKEKSLFLVGDTVPPNDAFPKLAQAGDEMKNIEKHFAESRERILSGSEATPSAYLRSEPERYSYLHFVTHGTASRARPLESAVILSKEKDEDSYKLYARDIVKRRLSAYLVTISACNTSGTRTFSGEGLIGLSWAFQRAGAHNVIGALWEVSDTATPELMNRLYDDLSHGKDPATALRDAQLSLLHSDSVFRKPRYWAPFQLYVGS